MYQLLLLIHTSALFYTPYQNIFSCPSSKVVEFIVYVIHYLKSLRINLFFMQTCNEITLLNYVIQLEAD